MKRQFVGTLAALAVGATMGGTALAAPFYVDVSAAGSAGLPVPFGDANTLTSVLKQFQLFADTTTVQFNTVPGGHALSPVAGFGIGDKFSDHGFAALTAGLPPGSDTEGINLFSEITIAWAGLTGTTTNFSADLPNGQVITSIRYDAGAEFNFYFHDPKNAVFGDLGIGDNTGFTDGTPVLTIEVTGGSGSNRFSAATGTFVSGESVLQGKITSALADFWWFDNGDGIPGTAGDKDFADLLGMTVPLTLVAAVDQNTDNVATAPGNPLGLPNPFGAAPALFSIDSDHDGSIDFTVVPEPGTMLLLGSGLLGLAGVGRRRSKKA